MKEKEYMEKSNQGNKPSNSPIIVMLLLIIIILLIGLIGKQTIESNKNSSKENNTEQSNKKDKSSNEESSDNEKTKEDDSSLASDLFNQYYNKALEFVEAYDMGTESFESYLSKNIANYSSEQSDDFIVTNVTKEKFVQQFNFFSSEFLDKFLNNQYQELVGGNSVPSIQTITFKNGYLSFEGGIRGKNITYEQYKDFSVTSKTDSKIIYQVSHSYLSNDVSTNSSFSFVMIKENNNWKVNQIDIVY